MDSIPLAGRLSKAVDYTFVMAHLNVLDGSKVTIYVTPSRIRRGVRGSGKLNPVSLALVEQVGLKNVHVFDTHAVGFLPNNKRVHLTPVRNTHKDFMRCFDRGWITGPVQINITYKVAVS